MKTTESAWVRHLIEKDLQETSLKEQLGNLIGSIDSRKPGKASEPQPHSLKAQIRKSNWRT